MKIILFLVLGLSVLGGLYLAITILSNKKPPLSAANIHGGIGLFVLILVFYNASTMKSLELWIAFAMLMAASAGGIFLVNNHKKDQLGPKSAVYIHGIFAIAAIVLIVISI